VRRLFLKIFLWFWVSTSLVWSAFVLTAWFTESRPPMPPWHQDLENVVSVYGSIAVREYERGGPSALEAFLRSVDATASVRAYLFDVHGVEIERATAPERIRNGVFRFAHDERNRFAPERGALLGFARVKGSAGTSYLAAISFPVERPLGSDQLVLRLVAAVVVAGLGCYALAYYLVLPVMRLREASRRLAAGDLTARAGARLQSRRDEFGDLGRDFDDMAERLEAFLVTERRLLRDISHELRSPLARLGVALGLARQASGPDAAFALDRIEIESERLNELIGRLLTLARLQGGEKPFRRSDVDLETLVRGVVADAAFEVREKDRAIRIQEAHEVTVSGDESLLRSAVENVVRNAVRHTASGTEVEVRLTTDAEADRQVAVVEVTDHGPGVADDVLAEIFRPFYRVDDARDRVSGGAGLGLAIADGAVRLHDGTIEAANAPGGGLRVTIRLPVTVVSSQ
jgi:two-component system, OmpR family, sensor histidine kinase CpxA